MIGQYYRDAPFMAILENVPAFEHLKARTERIEVQKQRIETMKNLPKYVRKSINLKENLLKYKVKGNFHVTYNNSK